MKTISSQYLTVESLRRREPTPVIGEARDSGIVLWNEAAERAYGYAAHQLAGCSTARLIAPDDYPSWQHITRHVLAGECVVDYRTHLVAADGSHIEVGFDLYPMRDGERITGIVAAQRRPAETPYLPDEDGDPYRWTRSIVETAVDGIISFDHSGVIENLNPSAERMFRYEAEDLLGRNIDTLIPLGYLEGHHHYVEDGAGDNLRASGGVLRQDLGKRKDGSTFPVEFSVSEVSLEGRRIFTVILHDITKRRRAQVEKDELLRDLNKRNIELTCLYRAGEAMRSCELLSDMFQEVVRLICPAFLYPDITRCRLTFDGDRYVSSPFSGTPWRLAADVVVAGRKRGEVEVFYMAERPELDEGPFLPEERELIDAITSDIGFTVERREAEAQVIQASKLASIGELAAGVGHEINNPLNGIMNCADILAEDFEEGTKQRQFADLIRSEAERIANIVRNLLAFSRQDREYHSPARLCDIVEVVLSLSRKKIEKSHIQLVVDVPEDLPKVRCRSEQLQQVFMNLIINAWHALDERYRGMNPDKILAISAEPIQLKGKPFIRLTVEDHGCGIAPAHMERLFDPFFTTKGRDVGTGLGLSISDAIVKQHGGQMTVESELGRYARFHVDLPLGNGDSGAGTAPDMEEDRSR